MKKTGVVTRYICAGKLVCIIFFPAIAGATASGQAIVNVTINNPMPTCGVVVPEGTTQNLGKLDRTGSDQIHPAFAIQFNCDGEIKTRMKASATSGAVQSDGKSLAVVMNNDTSMGINNRPLLKLRVSDQFVNLQDGEWFCTTSSSGKSHKCDITPVTVSNNETQAGAGKATVSFTIDYFL